MRLIGDAGGIKIIEVLNRETIWGVAVKHPPPFQVPVVIIVPGSVAYHYHASAILIVSQHITHGEGVVPISARVEGEHDVVLLEHLQGWRASVCIPKFHLGNPLFPRYLVMYRRRRAG